MTYAPLPSSASAFSPAGAKSQNISPTNPGESGALTARKGRRATRTQAAQLSRRDNLIMEHLPLVKVIATRIYQGLPAQVDLDDLVHAGILGLIDAASKFNPSKQAVFSSYAKFRIRGEILDSLRQLDWASRDARRQQKAVEATRRELAASLQRAPTDSEMAGKLGIDIERWHTMVRDLPSAGMVSASSRNEDDDLPVMDLPSNPETRPDSMCRQEELRSVMGEAMKTLPERYQKVVVLYYNKDMTMKEIGGVLGINESRVSQIHKAALEKMAVTLESNGISSSRAF